MVSNINTALEEEPTDRERDYIALRIAIVSGRASSLPSPHLEMWEMIFLSIWKGLVPSRGRLEGVYRKRGSL